MRPTERIRYIILSFGAVLPFSQAVADTCSCSGPNVDHYTGGDGQPLYWEFSVNVVESNNGINPLICYSKSITNKSNGSVRDIRWEVANFYRRIVAQNSTQGECPIVRGSTKEDPTNGSLELGPSSSGYATTVRQPKDGWDSEHASLGSSDSSILVPAVTTSLTFGIENKDESIATAQLSITSSAKSEGKSIYLQYTLQNDSKYNYFVYVNAPASKEIMEKVPFVQAMQEIQPNSKLNYTTTTAEEVDVRRAQVIIFDLNKKILAIGSAGIYTSKIGVKLRSDRLFWNQIDK